MLETCKRGYLGCTGCREWLRKLCCGSAESCVLIPIVIITYITSCLHAVLGIFSVVIGVLLSRSAEVWMAHRVSPIWSGGFYLLAALIGIVCAKKRTPYLVMCFVATCIVSMVVAVVCIQLARLGLVMHLSDGATYKQDNLDVLVIITLVVCGLEILLCILSFPVACKMATQVKEEVHMKRDGTFSIQIVGEKDIVICLTDEGKYTQLREDDTMCSIAQQLACPEKAALAHSTPCLQSPSSETIKVKDNQDAESLKSFH